MNGLTHSPLVSVVIPTRGDRARLTATLESLARSTYANFEVVIAIDGAASESAMDRIDVTPARARGISVRQVRAGGHGAAAARNHGIWTARGEFVAFTDDDCTVPEAWLDRTVAQLMTAPEPGLLTGPLRAGPHDPAREYIPIYEPATSERLTHPMHRPWRLGVSANLAARRSTLQALGGFDPRLGTGTRFKSAEDKHLCYRVLRAGLMIQVDAANPVLHWGARKVADGTARQLLRDSWFGMGACYGLLTREGDPRATLVFGRELVSLAVGLAINGVSGAHTVDKRLAACALAGFLKASSESSRRPPVSVANDVALLESTVRGPHTR